MTGGHAHIFDEAGVRRFREDHRFWGRPLREVRPLLRREPCEMTEFHCMLVRADVFRRLGPFDEGLKSALENPDFCMSVRQAGGEIYCRLGRAIHRSADNQQTTNSTGPAGIDDEDRKSRSRPDRHTHA